jgi:hypothetical protein
VKEKKRDERTPSRLSPVHPVWCKRKRGKDTAATFTDASRVWCKRKLFGGCWKLEKRRPDGGRKEAIATTLKLDFIIGHIKITKIS